ncbi:ABC transporter permease [Mucilaginibacter sp. BT774]|uniref:ABC transporter permease n=1 Tax=Mucilaginibacter sp. BT774 TaxID=3062276 RepID=UPI002677373A|nr:ABC transporter permease [Mucilaginibacter sp. BT774]MDO3625108.1 ABC transporter permease [Mucilaginibacter sp. BT774]
MIRNYIKTAWRNLAKNKVFSFINVFGLAVGLACCMFIAAYLYTELTYDTYSVNSEQLYRVGITTLGNGSVTDFPMVDVAVGPGMKRTYPQVLDVTRLTNRGPAFVTYNNRQFKEEKMVLVDSNFLRLFSIPLIQGDEKTALTEPKSIVITNAFATKYFGAEAPVGKMLKVGNDLVKVTGVIDKVPDNSHFHYDAFISSKTFPDPQQTWSNVGYYTYLLLDKNADPKKLESQFPQLVAKYVVPEIQHDMGVSLAEAQKAVNTFKFYLLPITDIHLHSSTKFDMEPNGDMSYVYIFGALAVFILLLACINFTNLSTASSSKRSKEVGIRKVMGSLKEWLVTQFLVESIMLTLLAMILALGIVWVLLPYFNDLAGKHISIWFFLSFKSLAIGVCLTLLVGILAGLYPAFFLSSFQIISVLKGTTGNEPAKKNFIQSGLVVFQFTISTALIIATFIVYQQLHYMQNKKLGYDKDQLLVLNDTYLLGNNEYAFKDQLMRDSRVVNATVATDIPGNGHMSGTEIYPQEKAANETKNEIHCNIYRIDGSYLSTFGIKLASGRGVSPDFPADSSAVVINEAAVNELGWSKTDPIGKTIVRSGRRAFTVVGVVKDFNYTSARQKVAPLMLLATHRHGSTILKIKAPEVNGLIDDIKKQWGEYKASGPFSYYFVDEQFASLYSAEQRTGHIFTSFAVIAVIIASLGLFGLAAFMIKLRVKEIGIRKVLGASSSNITAMLSTEFLKLVLIAIIISFPITWFAMNKWLQDFAYRIDIQWWVFILAGCIALLIALITISFQSVKAALANPVKSLKSE